MRYLKHNRPEVTTQSESSRGSWGQESRNAPSDKTERVKWHLSRF